MKGMFRLTVFLTVIVMMAMSAYATPMLKISSGGATCTLGDGDVAAVCGGGGTGSGDILAGAGSVAGSFSVGNFTVNVSTGITKPAQGSAAFPFMDLNTVNTSTGGGGTLVLEFSETGFTGTGAANIFWGGTAAGTATYQVFYDPGNVVFTATTQLGTSGLQGPGAYSGTLTGGAASGTYSLTQRVTYIHQGSGVSSGDHALSIPEPGILSLLGVGLAGIGLIRRRLS